jgi:hypothetical protein
MRASRAAFAALTGAVMLALGIAAAPALADSTSIDFETYNPGALVGQQGWTGNDCGPAIDEAVVLNSGFPTAPASFATKSMRMSNATTSGCFRDAFSPPLTDEAGEPAALNGGLGGGTRQPMFVAQWTFASSTGAYQPGLDVQVSPDRGDGARMGYVGMRMEGGSLTIVFVDVQGVVGTAPCFQCANFVETDFPGYDPTKPHTIRLESRYLPGPSNDLVALFVDGHLLRVGGSWEDYYTMDTESSPTPALQHPRTVNRLLIRAKSPAEPGTLGQGYLLDNVSYSSGPLVGSIPTTLEADPLVLRLSPFSLNLLRVSAHLSVGTIPVPGKTIKFTAPLLGQMCTGVTNATGTATCTLPPSLVPLLGLLSLHYDASFAGDGTYLASSDTSNLIK